MYSVEISDKSLKVYKYEAPKEWEKEDSNNKKNSDGGGLKGIGTLGAIFVLFLLIVGISSGEDISKNKTFNEDVSENIRKCESVILEFNKIENVSQVNEIYINASNQLEETEKKTNVNIFKIIGGIAGILIGVTMTVIWLRRINYERVYRIPDMIWILKNGGILLGILIILIVILTVIVGFDVVYLAI